MGSIEKRDREKKKKDALKLYLSNNYQQKEIAEIIGVVENTITRWIKKYNWESMRANLTTTKENVLSQLYGQLAEINNNIQSREEGQRFATSKEADSIIKLSSATKKMETETGIAEIVSVCKGLCEFVRSYDIPKAQEISDHFNAYIEYKLN